MSSIHSYLGSQALRICVKVEVAVLSSPSLISLVASVDVKQHLINHALDLVFEKFPQCFPWSNASVRQVSTGFNCLVSFRQIIDHSKSRSVSLCVSCDRCVKYLDLFPQAGLVKH